MKRKEADFEAAMALLRSEAERWLALAEDRGRRAWIDIEAAQKALISIDITIGAYKEAKVKRKETDDADNPYPYRGDGR